MQMMRSEYRSFADPFSSAVHDTQSRPFTAGIKTTSNDAPQRGETEDFEKFGKSLRDSPAIHSSTEVSTSPEIIEIIEDPACTVCCENLDTDNFPAHKVTSTCQHEPDICKTCLASSIATQFSNKIWDQVACPTCHARLSFHDIQEFATKDIFEK